MYTKWFYLSDDGTYMPIEEPRHHLITEEEAEEFTEYGSYDVDYSDLDEELENPDF